MGVIKSILQRADWGYFRKAAVILIAASVISSVTAMASYVYVAEKRLLNAGSQTQLNKMKVRYQNAVNQQQLVGLYYQKYKKLVQQGFIGNGRRLDWVENLRAITEERKGVSIDYNIKALKPYKPGYKLNATLFRVNTSEIVLQMNLLHERDLLDIFSELDRRPVGLYDIKKCDLTMAGEKVIYEANAANIKAECTLNWFTIQLIRLRGGI